MLDYYVKYCSIPVEAVWVSVSSLLDCHCAPTPWGGRQVKPSRDRYHIQLAACLEFLGKLPLASL